MSNCNIEAINAETVVLKQLKQSFKNINKRYQEIWVAASQESLAALCSKEALSVKDLWDQYQNWTVLQSVVVDSDSTTPINVLLSKHEGVRDDMLHKLYRKVMRRVDIVEMNLKKLEEFSESVANEKREVDECFTRRQSTIGIQQFSAATSQRISAADLVQHIENLSCSLLLDYLWCSVAERRLCLQRVCFTDTNSLTRLIEVWQKNNSNIANRMEVIGFVTEEFLNAEEEGLKSIKNSS